MTIFLSDPPLLRSRLLPFTFTRPVADIRVGIVRIWEKWVHFLQQPLAFETQPYLQTKHPFVPSIDNLFINGGLFPDATLAEAIKRLAPGQALYQGEQRLALRTEASHFEANPYNVSNIPKPLAS